MGKIHFQHEITRKGLETHLSKKNSTIFILNLIKLHHYVNYQYNFTIQHVLHVLYSIRSFISSLLDSFPMQRS